MADALVSTSRVIAFFFVPLTVFFLILGEPTVRVAFKGMNFTEESVRITMLALPWYVMGLFFFALEDPLLKWFYALSDTKTPIAMGIAGDIIWFITAIVGVQTFGFGLSAIAFAMALSKTIKVLVLLGLLRPRLGEIDRGRILAFAGKLLVATVIMGAVTYVAEQQLRGFLPMERLLGQAALLGAGMGVALVVYLVASLLLRVEECRLVTDRLKAKLGRRNA
jgi:putative peptidoglycan lipid II flippase